MDINTQDLRATLAALPTSGRGRRYTPELRDQVVAAVRSARDAGQTWDAIAVELLAPTDPARSAALLTQAVTWIHQTAATEVPEPFRHGFLHQHPVHRRLLAMAGARPGSTASAVPVDTRAPVTRAAPSPGSKPVA